ncbi:PrpF protein [Duganella sp. Leaf126]|uniref:PrpF domain-containing protein n=1 Tax=Duganella sp. Leaf126 TaxID=1736266 RepID=UPI0006F7AEF7|nr:PrpF domain-containing protein [Duganella sp. Leaf126]KQQ40382.1 PrpF protein [Duganella sp. Leaf126]
MTPLFAPRLRHGVLEFPVHHMRGGTSTGLVLWDRWAPQDLALREELLRHLMGVPLGGHNDRNRQITGLGRGTPTSNKVFFADIERSSDGDVLVSTLAQLAHNHDAIDWSVNCGNMSAALQLWALDSAMVSSAGDLQIRNTNTGVTTVSRMHAEADGRYLAAAIPGVDGAYPAVDLFMQSPVGAKTGRLLPTGSVCDVIDGYTVSCVDVAVPMVICDAAELGKSAQAPIAELDADPVFKQTLRSLWVAAGLRMGLRRRDGSLMTGDDLARSETIPKICIVGQPEAGGNIAVRYFTPQAGHASMAVSGGCCLAAATLIPGSVAQQAARGLPPIGSDFADVAVGIENPAGILDATVVARMAGGLPEIGSAAYRRSAQVLLRGHVPLYRASAALVAAVLARAGQAVVSITEPTVS